MTKYPNLDRLAQADPTKLTARELQVHAIHQDYESKPPGHGSNAKTYRMADAVPALLAHIDELYGEVAQLLLERDTSKAIAGEVVQQLTDLRDDVLGDETIQIPEVVAAAKREIERLRAYAETTKHHQDQHAAAVRDLEKLRADHTEVAAAEFEAMARDLYRRADNLPLGDNSQVTRLGDFREIADKLMARAEELRGTR